MSYCRLKSDFEPGHNHETIKAGTLLFPWRASTRVEPGCVILSVDPKGWGYSLAIPEDQVERDPQPKWQDFEILLRYYMVGAEVPPNLIEGDADTMNRDLDSLAHSGCLISHGYGGVMGGRILLPSMRRGQFPRTYGEMAFAIASQTQGGNYTGEAVVLIYHGAMNKDLPRTARFKICDHAIEAGASARPERGWHPSRCTKCGLDTSVDSSD